MPTYEYKCEKCGVFDYKQSMKDDALATCPTCGTEVKRLISRNVGVVYKGSGFYTTDSRNKSEPACGQGGGCGGGSCPMS